MKIISLTIAGVLIAPLLLWLMAPVLLALVIPAALALPVAATILVFRPASPTSIPSDGFALSALDVATSGPGSELASC